MLTPRQRSPAVELRGNKSESTSSSAHLVALLSSGRWVSHQPADVLRSRLRLMSSRSLRRSNPCPRLTMVHSPTLLACRHVHRMPLVAQIGPRSYPLHHCSHPIGSRSVVAAAEPAL